MFKNICHIVDDQLQWMSYYNFQKKIVSLSKIRKLFWNQNRHIWGGQRKGKMLFDHSFCLQKDVFWIFPILGVKGVFYGFFGFFFQIPKPVLESEQAHLGVK